MYKLWTKEEIKESRERFCRLYVEAPVDYRFLCGHAIQCENDDNALDYYMIGAWMVQHRRYKEWLKKKTFDMAEILEFMHIYRMRIPRYIRRTKFYRKKRHEFLNI